MRAPVTTKDGMEFDLDEFLQTISDLSYGVHFRSKELIQLCAYRQEDRTTHGRMLVQTATELIADANVILAEAQDVFFLGATDEGTYKCVLDGMQPIAAPVEKLVDCIDVPDASATFDVTDAEAINKIRAALAVHAESYDRLSFELQENQMEIRFLLNDGVEDPKHAARLLSSP